MFSKVSVTYQMDDMPAAARELADGVRDGFTLQKNAAGLLFCYSDVDVEELAASIKECLNIDIIGCTCIATLDGEEGFHEMAATLVVLTADDCEFSAALTGDITADNVESEVEAAYEKAKQAIPGDPKLVFALPPYTLDAPLDKFTNTFNRIAGGVPVIGGIPSNNENGDINGVIHDGNVYPTRLALLCISGNLNPVWSVRRVTGSSVERKRKVTSAEGNVVHRVGDQKFADYMMDLGFTAEMLTQGNTTTMFVSNPLLLEQAGPDGEVFSFVRTLHKVDPVEGSGTAVGYIPEGATLSICSLEKSDIEQAAVLGMRELNEKIAANSGPDYQYNTVLAVSCIGRYLLMLPTSDVEAKQILSNLREGFTMGGFYSYGEIGPVPTEGNAIKSFAYNESLVLCAF